MSDDMEWFEDVMKDCSEKHHAIDEGVQKLISDNACMHFKGFGRFVVGRSIVITEVIDQVGENHLVSFASPPLKPWEILGMLNFTSEKMVAEDYQ